MERSAWFCPSCQKHHAPHIETCPAPVDLIGKERFPRLPPQPVTPWILSPPGYDPCAGCSGVCGNVACPKLMRSVCGMSGAPFISAFTMVKVQ